MGDKSGEVMDKNSWENIAQNKKEEKGGQPPLATDTDTGNPVVIVDDSSDVPAGNNVNNGEDNRQADNDESGGSDRKEDDETSSSSDSSDSDEDKDDAASSSSDGSGSEDDEDKVREPATGPVNDRDDASDGSDTDDDEKRSDNDEGDGGDQGRDEESFDSGDEDEDQSVSPVLRGRLDGVTGKLKEARKMVESLGVPDNQECMAIVAMLDRLIEKKLERISIREIKKEVSKQGNFTDEGKTEIAEYVAEKVIAGIENYALGTQKWVNGVKEKSKPKPDLDAYASAATRLVSLQQQGNVQKIAQIVEKYKSLQPRYVEPKIDGLIKEAQAQVFMRDHGQRMQREVSSIQARIEKSQVEFAQVETLVNSAELDGKKRGRLIKLIIKPMDEKLQEFVKEFADEKTAVEKTLTTVQGYANNAEGLTDEERDGVEGLLAKPRRVAEVEQKIKKRDKYIEKFYDVLAKVRRAATDPGHEVWEEVNRREQRRQRDIARNFFKDNEGDIKDRAIAASTGLEKLQRELNSLPSFTLLGAEGLAAAKNIRSAQEVIGSLAKEAREINEAFIEAEKINKKEDVDSVNVKKITRFLNNESYSVASRVVEMGDEQGVIKDGIDDLFNLTINSQMAEETNKLKQSNDRQLVEAQKLLGSLRSVQGQATSEGAEGTGDVDRNKISDDDYERFNDRCDALNRRLQETDDKIKQLNALAVPSPSGGTAATTATSTTTTTTTATTTTTTTTTVLPTPALSPADRVKQQYSILEDKTQILRELTELNEDMGKAVKAVTAREKEANQAISAARESARDPYCIVLPRPIYDIPKGFKVTQERIEYFTQLMLYAMQRKYEKKKLEVKTDKEIAADVQGDGAAYGVKQKVRALKNDFIWSMRHPDPASGSPNNQVSYNALQIMASVFDTVQDRAIEVVKKGGDVRQITDGDKIDAEIDKAAQDLVTSGLISLVDKDECVSFMQSNAQGESLAQKLAASLNDLAELGTHSTPSEIAPRGIYVYDNDSSKIKAREWLQEHYGFDIDKEAEVGKIVGDLNEVLAEKNEKVTVEYNESSNSIQLVAVAGVDLAKDGALGLAKRRALNAALQTLVYGKNWSGYEAQSLEAFNVYRECGVDQIRFKNTREEGARVFGHFHKTGEKTASFECVRVDGNDDGISNYEVTSKREGSKADNEYTEEVIKNLNKPQPVRNEPKDVAARLFSAYEKTIDDESKAFDDKNGTIVSEFQKILNKANLGKLEDEPIFGKLLEKLGKTFKDDKIDQVAKAIQVQKIIAVIARLIIACRNRSEGKDLSKELRYDKDYDISGSQAAHAKEVIDEARNTRAQTVRDYVNGIDRETGGADYHVCLQLLMGELCKLSNTMPYSNNKNGNSWNENNASGGFAADIVEDALGRTSSIGRDDRTVECIFDADAYKPDGAITPEKHLAALRAIAEERRPAQTAEEQKEQKKREEQVTELEDEAAKPEGKASAEPLPVPVAAPDKSTAQPVCQAIAPAVSPAAVTNAGQEGGSPPLVLAAGGANTGAVDTVTVLDAANAPIVPTQPVERGSASTTASDANKSVDKDKDEGTNTTSNTPRHL